MLWYLRMQHIVITFDLGAMVERRLLSDNFAAFYATRQFQIQLLTINYQQTQHSHQTHSIRICIGSDTGLPGVHDTPPDISGTIKSNFHQKFPELHFFHTKKVHIKEHILYWLHHILASICCFRKHVCIAQINERK